MRWTKVAETPVFSRTFSEPRAVMERREYDVGQEKPYPDLVKVFHNRQRERILVHNDIDELARIHVINLSKTPSEDGFFTQTPTVRDRSAPSFLCLLVTTVPF